MAKKKVVEITEQQFVEMLAVGLDVVWDGWYKGYYGSGSLVRAKTIYLENPTVLDVSDTKYRSEPDDEHRQELDILYMAIVEEDSNG